MPSKINQELVRAFNINLCHNEVAITNLTVQNVRRGLYKKDYIVISFDKSMDAGQCMKYLHNMKERIVETFCRSESTAGMSFDTSFFPFKFNKKQLDKDSRRGYRFLVPIDRGVIFNLKCLLANGVAKDIAEDIGKNFGVEYAAEHTDHISFDREFYLYCRRFNDWKLKVRFINLLSSKIIGYGNAPMDYLEIIDNRVYIKKSIFDNVEFIKNIVKDKASLICRDFEVPSSEDEVVESLKFPIIDLLYEIGIPVDFIFHTSYTGSGENSVLVPAAMKVISNIEYYEFLSKKEVDYINNVFGMVVLNNIEDCTSSKHLPVSGNGGIYGIDFYDEDISYCVLNKIIENSLINARHELSIDPELVRALSPAQSPFNSPTHAGPSGLRTPPNQRRSIDSGIGESPPKPKDSGSSSGGPSSGLTELSSPTQEFPTQSQGEELGRSSRRGSEREEETGRMSQLVPEGEIGQASTSSQQTDDMPRRSYTSRYRRTPLMSQPSTLRELSLSESAYESMLIEIQGQQVRYRPPSIPFPIAWDNSISLNLGVSEDSPKDTENICNEGHKEQKVIGKSDQKSRDECSEPKSKESESPEKHGGGLFCKKGMPILAKLSPFKRRSVERDTMCSSKSDLVYHVTEKSSVSKPFFSFPTRIKAKSNPPSEVTSPTHEGGSEWQQRLDPDQREELCKVLSPEMKEKLNSNSFSPGKERLLYLTHTPEGKRELSRSLCEGKESQLLRLTKAQLPDNSSSERDSGYSSGLPASPALPHKESVSSEVKECRTVEHTRETWGKRI
ncbi:hypothetical protein [Wolbachia endosymbiont (group A) of Volucella inflata]|uniref:hypothetical protein n=1 Tax=Wolbachia endosymbiont (group A) of Volucella inflata TaxID=2954065 RepID=UPI002227EB16|nr:hypothetical protein [Wolbachia endosymbiont (group A) of Volucella inflata]